MRRIGSLVLAVLAGWAGSARGEQADVDGAAKLRRLPPNTWVDLGVRSHGGAEIGWVYDEANRLFLKYGG